MEKGHAAPFEAEELIEYLPALRGLARALVRGDEVEDLVAATMLRAVERPPTHRGNVRAWLARTLRNLAVDRGRKHGTRRRTAAAVEQQVATRDVPPTPDAMMARSEALRLLHEMLDEMGDPDRHLLFLRYFDGLNANEIGERLDILPATARTRLSAALGRLRARLRDRYGKEAFAPCFLIIEPLSRLVPMATTTVGGATLGSLFTFKKVMLGLLPVLVMLAAYLKWGDAWIKPTATGEVAQSPESSLDASAANDGLAIASTPSTETDRAPTQNGDPSRVILVDEAGDPLAEHQVQIYFRGKGFARLSDADGSFLWPQEFQEGGLLFIWAKGRVPIWLWREADAAGQYLEVPDGRCLTVTSTLELPDGAPRPVFELDFSGWTPQPGSVGFELREHLPLAGNSELREPYSVYTQPQLLRPDDFGHCRFRGLPEGEEVQLRLRSRSFDWVGAELDPEWQTQRVPAQATELLAELALRPHWQLHMDAEGEAGRALLAQASFEISVEGSGRARFSVEAAANPDGSRQLWIPQDPRFPEPSQSESWSAVLSSIQLGTRLNWALDLPRGGGRLADEAVPEAHSFPINIVDGQGNGVGHAIVQMNGESYPADAFGRALIPVFVDPMGQPPASILIDVKAQGFIPSGRHSCKIEQGVMQVELEAEHGLRVRCRLMRNGVPVNTAAEVRLRTKNADPSKTEGLFGRALSAAEEKRLLCCSLLQPLYTDTGKMFAVRGPSSSAGCGEFSVLGLAPHEPLILSVHYAGERIYRELIDSIPAGELLERELELELPATLAMQGVVMDDVGKRVPGARVYGQTSTGAQLTTYADLFGEFRFHDLTGLRIKLAVDPGRGHWLRKDWTDFVLSDSDQACELVIQRAREIVVHVIDAAGQMLGGKAVAASIPGNTNSLVMGKALNTGAYRFTVPLQGEIQVMVRHLGVQFDKRFDVSADEFTMRLPEGVAVAVDWSAIDLPEHTWLYLMAEEQSSSRGGRATIELIAREGPKRINSEALATSRGVVHLPPGTYRFWLTSRALDGSVFHLLQKASAMEEVTVATGTPQSLRFVPAD